MEGNLRAQSYSPAIIALMYHRVDIIVTDPWSICVSPPRFEKQVKFLKNNFNVISTGDLINQVTTGNITDNSICITFDDGYADNYVNAKSILEKYDCPATFFIATAFINQPKPFWWDELEIILLHSKKLSCSLSLQIDEKTYEYVPDEKELTGEEWLQHTYWKWYKKPPTDRCMIFLDIWEKLRPLPYEETEKQMTVIRNWACADDNGYMRRLPINEQQLYELSKNNLFTIAMHTHSHSDLQSKEKQVQLDEILSCKKFFSDKYNIESNCLAYPYGNYNSDTIEVIKELQIAGCFTTEAGVINVNSDLTKLRRYQVFNWNITRFKDLLNIWSKNLHSLHLHEI